MLFFTVGFSGTVFLSKGFGFVDIFSGVVVSLLGFLPVLFLWSSSTPVFLVGSLTVQLFDPLLFLRCHYILLLLPDKGLYVDVSHNMTMFTRLLLRESSGAPFL